jgi:hypothetical protein
MKVLEMASSEPVEKKPLTQPTSIRTIVVNTLDQWKKRMRVDPGTKVFIASSYYEPLKQALL